MKPQAIILTGPPGSGKTTLYKEYLSNYEQVDTDTYPGTRQQKALYKKTRLKELRHQNLVLHTSAPTRLNKEYWYSLLSATHNVTLLTLMPPKLHTINRMQAREQYNNLHKHVEHWYKRYTRHSREQRYPSGRDAGRALAHRHELGLGPPIRPRERDDSAGAAESQLQQEGCSQRLPSRVRVDRWGTPFGSVG